jgi:hypothetical protein
MTSSDYGLFGDADVLAYFLSNVCESRFTGKERDTESGLDYFGARYMGGWPIHPNQPILRVPHSCGFIA